MGSRWICLGSVSCSLPSIVIVSRALAPPCLSASIVSCRAGSRESDRSQDRTERQGPLRHGGYVARRPCRTRCGALPRCCLQTRLTPQLLLRLLHWRLAPVHVLWPAGRGGGAARHGREHTAEGPGRATASITERKSPSPRQLANPSEVAGRTRIDGVRCATGNDRRRCW